MARITRRRKRAEESERGEGGDKLVLSRKEGGGLPERSPKKILLFMSRGEEGG